MSSLTRGELFSVGGGVGTVLGAALGALVGGRAKRWEGAGLGALVGGASGAVIVGGLTLSGVLEPAPATPPELGSGPSTRTACHPWKPVAGDSVVLVGDSIGVGIAPILKAKLANAYPSVAFLPLVKVGDNARMTRQRIANLSFQGLALVSLGSNDAAGNVDAEAAQVQGVIDQLGKEGARIVWIPGPNFSIPDPPPPATKEKQKAFSRQVQHDPRPELYSPSAAVIARMRPDKIHLDDQGYTLLVDELLSCLGVPTS